MQQDEQTKNIFSKKGAWLGLIAYAFLIAIITIIFIFG